MSYFYKAFVYFLSHAIELTLKQFLNYLAEENFCCADNKFLEYSCAHEIDTSTVSGLNF